MYCIINFIILLNFKFSYYSCQLGIILRGLKTIGLFQCQLGWFFGIDDKKMTFFYLPPLKCLNTKKKNPIQIFQTI